MKEQNRIDLTTAEEEVTSVRTGMDPRLQLLVARRRSGITKRASVATDVDEVGVIARVSDARQWRALSEVRDATVIGAVESGEYIVTGRIPVQRIERVRGLPFVLSLKAAQRVRPMLSATTRETLAEPDQLPQSHKTHGGRGVVVGVVDYGMDFTHQNFRRSNGSTRLLTLWDQNGGNDPSSPFGYGKEHPAATIGLALAQADPYSAIGYDPTLFDPGTGTHGTHVADIAAGNGRGSGVPGMAPEADLIFVNITHARDAGGADVVGESFGDSVALLEALKYIFDKAQAKPAVVNVSLGTNGGPHDGTTLVEQGIDSLVSAAPNRAAVFAASNSYDDGIHAAGQVVTGQQRDLVWDVAARLVEDIELEVWYSGEDQFQVELVAPNGVILATVAPGETKQVNASGTVAALVANRLNDPNNGDNMIGVYLAAGLPAGKYMVRLTGVVVQQGAFHAWIERDNNFQSRFLPPHDNRYTIGSVSCGKNVIAVGSYDGHVQGRPLSWFSSAGPTRDGRNKPDVSAPGHEVWAARSGTGTGVTRMSGTSMAAPAVVGMVALMFEEAVARGHQLTAAQTVDIVRTTARRNPPTGSAWHERYGHGRVDVAAALAAIAALPAATAKKPKRAKKPKKAARAKRSAKAKRTKRRRG